MEMKFSLTLTLFFTTALAEFSTDCPQECRCLWELGKKAADCSKSHLQDIPRTLSSDIQILNMSENNLNEITKQKFKIAGIINLVRLFMNDCNLTNVHKNGLSGLSILMWLNLSNNKLKSLHPDTFREITNVRWISLNNNELEKLEGGLFNDLPVLQQVDLSNNKIFQLETKSFLNVPRLETIKLNANKLENIQVDALSDLTTLSTLELHNNPWRCDCHLNPLEKWLSEKNFNLYILKCAEPPELRGKLWTEIDSRDVNCSIVDLSTITNLPISNLTISNLPISNSNMNMSCQINGNPLPEVDWVLNPHVIEGTYQYKGDFKYNITHNNKGDTKLVKVTFVIDVDSI